MRWQTILIVLSALVLSSCYERNVNDLIYERASVSLKLSAENGRANSSAKAVFQPQDLELDDSYYREAVKGDAYLEGLTPVSFILDVDRVSLYDPKDKLNPQGGAKRTAWLLNCKRVGKWIVPNRINMISSKNIADCLITQSKLNRKWDGLCVTIRPGGGEFTNGMWAGSVFCVKLPDGIKRSMVKNALSEHQLPESVEHRSDENYAWIGFDEALPFKNGSTAYLCFQSKANGVSFINPEHADGSWTYGSENSNGNQSGIVLPMDQIDFSNLKTAEFVFMFDTDKCMDIYKSDTDGKYWITLKKKNPLPFKIVTQEYDSSTVVLDESQKAGGAGVPAPIQCFEYDWTENGKNPHLVFTYTRPNANGVDTIRIYSSTEEVFDKSRSTLVYEGNEYCYIIPANDENRGLKYFITALDKDGEESEAVSFLYQRAAFSPH